MVDADHLSPEQQDLLKSIEKSTAKDLVTPQSLTAEEEKHLDQLDKQYPKPVAKGQEDAAFEAFLNRLENKPKR